MLHERRVVDNAAILVDEVGHLLERLKVAAQTRLTNHPGKVMRYIARKMLTANKASNCLLVDELLRQLAIAHVRIAQHVPPVRFDDAAHAVFFMRPVLSQAAARDRRARGKPLDVPFPASGQRFIEVVDSENEAVL